MTTQAHLGATALAAGDYNSAISHYTAALDSSQSPVWLIQRATAYQRNNQFVLALVDASDAYHAARSRGKRDLMATSQFRRALALHGLKRYGDARICLTFCNKLNDKEKGLTIWMAKVKAEFEKAEAEGGSDTLTAITVKEVPDAIHDVGVENEPKMEPKKVTQKDNTPAKAAPSVVATPVLQATPKDKIREEWYQSNQTVSITVFAKGVPKDKAEVVIAEGELEVHFPTSGSSSYDYTVSPLFAKIDPSKSSFRVTPHKIEITLHKVAQGLKWATITGTEPIIPSEPTSSSATALSSAIKVEEKAPVYPTSSRTGPKNWDSIGNTSKDDEETGVDDFFKVLYKNADDDTKKAMMKSYQESNGTSLSTDWSSVSKGTVETMPPEGLVAKKWES